MGTLNKQQRCPKCGGNLFLYNDMDGWYEQCLQCSFTKFMDVVVEGERKVIKEHVPEPVPETIAAT